MSVSTPQKRPHFADPRSAKLTKWAVFGVALSLLPVAAKFVAAFMQGRSSMPAFDEVFGDGELLIVATVIAAVRIGDLTFDSQDNVRPQRRALAMTPALLTVIVSVLSYGFAHFLEEGRVAAQGELVQEGRIASVESGRQLKIISGQIGSLQEQIERLQQIYG